MANITNNSSSRETKRRLLEAAGEVFAESGFHAATIKAITGRAGTSLASVNYHFRDKAELHAAVLRRLEEEAAAIVPPDEVLQQDTPEERLRAFIAHVMSTMLGRADRPWERVLLAREFGRPTAARESLIEHIARPLNGKLGAILAELTGLSADSRAVALAAASAVAQCVYHLQHRGHIELLFPALDPRPTAVELSEHVYRLTVAAARAMAVDARRDP